MTDTVISVEGLGKRYRIGANRERYVALRDVVANGTKALGRRLLGRGEVRPSYEEFWALKDVSFEVKRGECVGIIGRNGAGKSTLLKLLSRITEPTTGRFRLKGRVASLLEVGTGFHPELTGRENVFLNGAILGMKRAEIARKFDEIVAFAEVEKFLETPVKYYSSGMYMRLAFAVAAHLEPEILVVDEVLAVGDAEFQRKCLGKMDEVARGGRTVLFVSHNMTAVQQLCITAVLLRGGRLHAEGAVGRVINEYLTDAATTENGRFDLCRHPARQSRYRAVIRELVLSDGESNPRATFRPQDRLVVDLEMILPKCLRDARIAIAIEDHLNRRIMTAANYFSPAVFPQIDGAVRVRCVVPRLGLGTGRYLVSASVGEKNHALLDSIDAAGWFFVEWDNNYATGEDFNPGYGPVLCDSAWSVFPANLGRKGVIE